MRHFGILAFLYIFRLTGFTELCAQPEQFSVHFDKPFYITGQTMWYKIYNTNYNASDIHSEVVFVNIHDQTGKLILQLKHRLIDGQTHGALTIPRQWSENYYYFTCFTQWNLQFDEGQCYTRKIAIYNSVESNEVKTRSDTTQKSVIALETQRISLEKQQHHRGEDVKLTIKGSDSGSCSVSVISKDEYEAGIQIPFSEGVSEVYIGDAPYEKEQGIILNANVTDPATRQPIESDLLLLYKTNSNSFQRVKAINGFMSTSLGWFDGPAEYQLMSMNPFQSNHPSVELEISGTTLTILDEDSALPPRTPDIERCIRNEKIRLKAQELFNENTAQNYVSPAFSPISLKPDKVYLMEKYQGMKSLEEFFREIVFLVELNSKSGQTTITLKNSETDRFFMENPWYLVDGKLTRDESAVLAIPFKNIHRIEIINTTKSILNQLDPLMVRSGLVVVYTDGNALWKPTGLTPVTFSVQGLDKVKAFDLSAAKNAPKTHENPEFRTPVYWNPDIETGAETAVVFPATDDPGDFIIIVEGLTTAGEYWKESAIYHVDF